MNISVKICCISNKQEANEAIAAGANAIGLVGKMPSGPGVIPDSLIKEIAQSVPGSIDSFLLTSEITIEGITAHYERCNTNVIQIVDTPQPGVYRHLKASFPKLKVTQVIHVLDEKSVQEAIDASQYVDFLLLDSGNPNLSVKELGGTGRTHNWNLSKKIRERSEVPIFLAGGITPQNVIEAIKTVQPYGIDLCSGVRTNGSLDNIKLKNFFKTIKSL